MLSTSAATVTVTVSASKSVGVNVMLGGLTVTSELSLLMRTVTLCVGADCNATV
jgi:hypothetical protein